MMVRRTAVLKFGGTSLGDEASREIAMLRVREAVQEGYAVVVVCSAMGRAPSPYATDSLLALTGGTLGGANVDLALAAGEMIAASVFAELLDRNQVPARALSGAQAGIRTDEHFGNANVVRVDPIAVEALLDAGIVPVVAGFQGATEHGDVTTLGRGGTDLSAIALGHAVGAERIDIYTDVSGAMTADPHRINGARRIERAELLEMSELAEHGAKVMHAKAADYAQQTRTPYAIKGLRSGVGTVVEAGIDRHSPVTGVTSTANLTFVRIIRGDIEDQRARMQLELEMFRRIAERQISIDQVNINTAGVFFVVKAAEAGKIRTLLGDLNMAVRVRESCAKLSIVGAGMRGTPGVIHRIVQALSAANVEIIHCTDSNITVSIVVPQKDAERAEAAVHDFFQLDREALS